MNKSLRFGLGLLVAFCGCFVNAEAQIPQSYYFTGSSAPNNFPLNRNLGENGNKIQLLYKASDFNINPNGKSVSRIYLNSNSSINFNYIGFSIKIGYTNDNSIQNFYYTDLTEVYRANKQITVASGQWFPVDLQKPFYFDPTKNLIIEITHSSTNANGTGALIGQGTASENRRIYDAGSNADFAFMGFDFNNALAFDGLDDRVEINTQMVAGQSYTKEAWVYALSATNGTTQGRNIISSSGDPFWLQNGSLYAGNSGSFFEIQSENFPLNKWTHVAVTFDSDNSNTMKLYKDGVLVNTKTGVPNSAGGVMAIGNYGTGDGFQGLIDNVRIWNTVRTAAEIAQNRNVEITSGTGLFASYNFNQGIAGGDNTAINILNDGSGNGNNGTIQNFNKTNGNFISNFVSSYALALPTATTATITPSSISANWTAPTNGAVSSYQLNYSTDATFATSNTVNSIAGNVNTYQFVTNVKPGTAYYYRVSAVSGTEVGGYSNVIAATTTALTPPGNALAFNGNQNVVIGNANTYNATTMRTVEVWAKFNNFNGAQEIVSKSTGSKGLELLIYNGNISAYMMGNGQDRHVDYPTTLLRTNKWYHFAITHNGSGSNLTLYVDGEAVRTTAGPANMVNSDGPLQLGSWAPDGNRNLNGTIDEVKIWSTLRTAEQIQADMIEANPSNTAGLLGYYNFDHGVAGANNVGITTLYDQFGTNNGVLSNTFALNGTVSNWVGSYAMVIPIATTATNSSSTGFTANWTMPATVTANSFIVEYSPTPNFNSKVFTVTATTNSYTFTNLESETANFYYRVSAVGDPGISAVSNMVKVVLNPLTIAGNALAFDGSDHVALENGPVLGDQFTQEAWILPQGNATFRAIIGGGSSTVNTATTRPPSMYVQNGTGLHGGFSDGVDWYTFSSPNVLTTGQWAHVAQSFDGTTLKVYVNGELIHSTVAYAGKHIQAVPVSKIGFINNYFLGSMDEVRVWNVTRTAQEIRDFYNKTLVGIPAGLVGYFRFNQGQANGDNTLITAAQNELGSKGLLVGFAKTGTVSNFVGSNNYPMEVATATTASSVSTNSFVANWNPTTAISATTYELDVASDADFATILPAYSNTNTGNVTSFLVSGLTPGSTYYYRVRANSEYFGTAANSNSITVTGNKVDQTITLALTTNTLVYGDADYALGASSTNSGIPLLYATSDANIATVSTTGTVQILNAGAVTITVSQAGDAQYNAAATVTHNLVVMPKAITATAEAKSKTYGDSDPALTYTFTPTLAFSDTFTGSVTRTTGENVGAYAISQGSLALSSNYTLTVVPATLTINSRAIAVTAESKSKTYGNADPALTYTFTPTLAFSDTFTGSVIRTTGENVGAYAITQGSLALSGNYTLTVVPATLTINSKAVVATAEAKSKTYGAADPALTYTFTPTLAFSDTFTGSVTRTTGENVGTYAITQGSLALSSNYTLTVVPATLTINSKAIVATAEAKSKTYGAADPVLTYSFSPTLAFSDTFTGSVTRTTGENVGTYAITQGDLALSNNYVITVVPATLTINSRAILATADAKSKTYGAADPALTYTFTPTLAFSDTFTGSVTRTTGENVGAYAITQGSLALSSNYALTVVPATLTINSKAIAVTAESKSKTYGAADPVLTYTFSPTLAFSDTFTGSVSRTTGENVGTYAISQGTLGLNGNYVLSYNAASLTITPKALTITADNKSRLQGVANPTLTVSYAGFITGQNNSNALSTQPNITTSANVTSLPGNYPITASAAVATNGNYAISYVGGTMTVNQAAVTSVGLAATSLFENRPAGTVAGTLSSTSTDPAATFTYTLVTGTGSADNARFTISGNQVLTAGPLDFEAQSGYAIRVRSTTQFGLTLEQTFTINIQDVNEAPTLDAVANQTVCYTTAVQQIALTGITPGPEANQALAMTIATNNPGLFSSLSVTKGNGTAGTFSYGISNGWSGTAIVTVTLKDDGGTANNGNDTFTRTFNITVNPLPVVTIWSSSGSNSISKGETISLKADAPGAASYSWSNANGIISGQNTATLTIRPTQTTTYTVTALNATGCGESKQLTIEVRSDFFAVKANNILTPNGDGANDTWIITNIDQYPNAEVKVFDRAGRIVFSKKGYDNSWNGSFNGTPLNEGAYLYVIDFGPGLYKAKGTVTILQSR